MTSEGPIAPFIPALTALASVASATAGIVSATSKPDEPKQPPAQVNQTAVRLERQRATAAASNRNIIAGGQKLGNVGNIG